MTTAEHRPGARIARTWVGQEPLSLSAHEALVAQAADGHAGAVVGFSGNVRDHDAGREVLALEYRSHPTAQQRLAEVVAEVVAGRAGVRAVAASHRVALLRIGEAALVVAVAADHRAEAFGVCQILVDEIKRQIPVWKRQHFADGSAEWVAGA
ncbi:molybdopterin biosynthesis MoaE protein [Segniliparus rotundus DSM 44985]|uniref:Molybdopterin biosynthesis MoaE protein n=1 Tax=Segniliparus rotundus (strain ATCC BAA-972 / CDC 1076 / CIP 108378 / DSM 44985 / JCM 13578) TaxID=640132 RepID=D6ZDP6_SEGRD|nr:molybdenum cofactor biosynthesis protein MoaE [Segniliparus rotundus]ADG99303.1 molybdopterin biosynthesis MoaE protein [Segniliparus rotundus DSM 44985]